MNELLLNFVVDLWDSGMGNGYLYICTEEGEGESQRSRV